MPSPTLNPATNPFDAAIIVEGMDAPFFIDTPYTIAVGDSFLGIISTSNDLDLIAFSVVAGETYQIDLSSPSVDMELQVYGYADDNGYIVSSNDNWHAGTDDARVTLSFAQSGTYYLRAGSADGMSTGTYLLAVSYGAALPIFSIEQIADQLTDGYWDAKSQAARHFDVVAGDSLDVDVTGLSAEGQFLASTALEAWTYVTGISFNLVSAGAQITFDEEEVGAFSSSNISGGLITSSSVNVSADWLIEHGTAINSYSFQTYIHEIGHALGLGHAGNYNGSAYYGVDNHYQNDNWQASVMSYMDQRQNTVGVSDWAYLMSPMIADILAIHNLYGSDTAQRLGNTTYGENSTAGGYLDGLAALSGAAIAFTVMDDGGKDTLDFHFDSADQVVDLRGGYSSSVWGLVDNLSIARGTIIEKFRAGAGDDLVSGNSAANTIWGRNGNDQLSGKSGADHLFGGAGRDDLSGEKGSDVLEGGSGRDVLNGNSGADILRGGGGGDILIGADGVDALYGDGGADRLYGNAGKDHLEGGAGNDRLSGGGGKDWLDGGTGNDRLIGGGGADDFVFGAGMGHDIIVDFSDDIDTLRLNGDLWSGTLTASQLIETFSFILDGAVVFDFGGGNLLTLNNLTDKTVLLNDLIVV